MHTLRHGCGSVLLLLFTPTLAWPSEFLEGHAIPTVGSETLDLEYTVPTEALPLTLVHLWVSVDGGQEWHLHGEDEDRRSPIRFQAEREGRYSFFIVLANHVGASSANPTSGQTPHHEVLIDTTAPLLQIKRLKLVQGQSDGEHTVAISWTAFDQNLSPHPVALYYQQKEMPGWNAIAARVPNVGRYDWKVVDGVGGEIEFRVEVSDLANNRVSDVATIVIPTSRIGVADSDTEKTSVQKLAAAQKIPLDPNAIGEDKAQERAQKLYELGVWHKERGDYQLAVQRLIEALNFDASLPAPAYELAEIYYTEGNYRGALDIYNSLLEHRPMDRDSLRGSALALVALRDYPQALSQLESVLREDSSDAQTWLDAGDVYLWMGKRDVSKKYWQQAIQLSSKKSHVNVQARERMRKFFPKSR